MAPRATSSSRTSKSASKKPAPKKPAHKAEPAKKKAAPVAKPVQKTPAPAKLKKPATVTTPSVKKTAKPATLSTPTKPTKDESTAPKMKVTPTKKSAPPKEIPAPPPAIAAAKEPKKKPVKAEPQKKAEQPKKVEPPKKIETPVHDIEKIVAEEIEATEKPRRAKKSKSDSGSPFGDKPKSSKIRKSATAEFLEEDQLMMPDEDDIELPDGIVDLDPLDAPVLLDPALAPPAPPTAAPAKPKVGRLAPRLSKCVNCGNEYPWLSVDGLCFSCVKKRLAQKKREEDYSGYSEESSSESDDSY